MKLRTLLEANLRQLFTKSVNETPKMAARAEKMHNDVRYFGLSEDGTLNFKIRSQSQPGKFYYAYIEAPDILKFGEITDNGDAFNEADLNRLLTLNGFRVHCNCPAFLYWAFQYMATQGNYEIEPETRAPKRNNTLLRGAQCKHLQAITYNIYNNKKIRTELVSDINNYLRMLSGLDYEDYQQLNHAKQIQQQNRSVKWKNNPTDYMNEYFARQAKNHPFLDDHDIKKSLHREVLKYARANPTSSTDDFLRDYFQMTKKAFADEMKIPETSVDDYFDEIGFTDKQEKQLAKLEKKNLEVTPDNPPKDSGLHAGILTNDSENLLEASKYYKDHEEAKNAYDKYIEGHVKNVNLALDLLKDLKIKYIIDNYDKLKEICSVHDASKKSDAEYEPYLHHFYPTNKEEAELEEEFETATFHHVRNNRHHWNCADWIDDQNHLKGFDKEVYLLYTVERICDWLAMAYQHSEKPTAWWDKQQGGMIMPDYARTFIEDIISQVPDDFKLEFKITRGKLDEGGNK